MEAWLAGCTLVLARVGAFVAFAPLIGGGYMPRTVKLGWILALTLFWLTPIEGGFWNASWQARAREMSILGWSMMLSREVLLGGLLGFCFSLFLFPARMAGDLIASEIGLTYGAVVTAKGEGGAGPIATFLEVFATMIFFCSDAHHLFLVSFDAWLQRFPVGGPLFTPVHGLGHLLVLGEHWAVLLAGPVILGLFLTTIVLLVLARAAPQFNLYSVGFPVRIGVGLLLLTLSLPRFGEGVYRMFWHLQRWQDAMR